MTFVTKIIVWSWTEPETGCDAAAFTTKGAWWDGVEKAVAWLRLHAGKEWGRTTPAVAIVPANHARSAPCKMDHVLKALALHCGHSLADVSRASCSPPDLKLIRAGSSRS